MCRTLHGCPYLLNVGTAAMLPLVPRKNKNERRHQIKKKETAAATATSSQILKSPGRIPNSDRTGLATKAKRSGNLQNFAKT